jgi:hypothetical protein
MLKIPDTPFRLFMSGGGRILGAAPLEGQVRNDFFFNHTDKNNGGKVMVVAITEKPCTMEKWEEIIRLAGTWENAAEMAVSAYGGVPWIDISLDRHTVVVPFLNGVLAEA